MDQRSTYWGGESLDSGGDGRGFPYTFRRSRGARVWFCRSHELGSHDHAGGRLLDNFTFAFRKDVGVEVAADSVDGHLFGVGLKAHALQTKMGLGLV
jgi:hypothetical protein